MKIENEQLIYHILKKHNLTHRIDDLYDIGLIGLVRGETSYNGAKNVKKSTYLYNCIKNEIFSEIRKENRSKRKADIIPIENHHLENISNDTDLEQDTLTREQINELYSNLFKLPIYEQYVVYQTYINGRTQKEIAYKLGFDVSKVKLLKKRGLKQMRELYKK